MGIRTKERVAGLRGRGANKTAMRKNEMKQEPGAGKPQAIDLSSICPDSQLGRDIQALIHSSGYEDLRKKPLSATDYSKEMDALSVEIRQANAKPIN